MPRGRKPKQGVCHTYEIKLYLWEGEDDDLIAFFENLPARKRAAGVRMALRSGDALANQADDALLDDEEMDFDLDDFINFG